MSASSHVLVSFQLEKMTTIHKFVILSFINFKMTSMSFLSPVLTLGTISAVHFHHFSTHVTCITCVHVIGDFCHITSRFTAPKRDASKNVSTPTVSEFDEIRRGS